MLTIPVYLRTIRNPVRTDAPKATFGAEGASPLGAILAPDGATLVTSRKGCLTLVVRGVAVPLQATEAVTAAKRGAFGLVWEPSD